jgi:tetratricopeptide (TPR) repeat protein/DNA-binding XRE family transcriptional regulator
MGVARDPEGRFARGQAIDPARLRHARATAGLTLTAAAAGIVSRQALSQFEHGQARPRRRTLEALAGRLHVPVDALLARPRDPREATMRELEAGRRWPELERLAIAVLADLNLTPRMEAVARYALGRAALAQDPDEALGHLRIAARQLDRVREPWLAAEALDWQGVALYYLQAPEALDVARQAVARYRLLIDREPAIESRMLEHVASCHLQRQEVADALDTYRAALAVADGVLTLARLANIYHGLASGCLRLGDVRQALDYFNRAVSFSRADCDVRGSVSVTLPRVENDYGHALLRAGQLDRAEEMIQAALDHFERAGVTAGKAGTMLSMGDLRRQQGQMDEALRWTGEAIELADQLGEVVGQAGAYQQLGELAALQGDDDRFEAAFARAVELTADLPERRAEALDRYRRVRADQAHPLAGA